MAAAGVRTGLDVLRERLFAPLRGRRLGLLMHPASVACDLVPALDLFLDAGLDLQVLLGPEHGLSGAAQDMVAVAGGCRRGIAAYSLYGDSPASLRPPPEALAGIDLLVVDLQDVGCRYYTFAATMRACLEQCGAAGVAVLVLDRPNPINGIDLEGPVLRDGFHSFVGAFRVPVRHGLTLGELARLAQADGVRVELEVIPMQGWRRAMWFDQTGLPWVLPSPNMPTLDTATVYAGACLVEATNLSEGRGTTRPFELLGAPWLDPVSLAAALSRCKLPGVNFRAATFTPAFQKHAGTACGGVQIHVTDRGAFRPFFTGLCFLEQARRQDQAAFAWREEPYEFVADRPAIDLLTGSDEVRLALEAGRDLEELAGMWEREIGEFAERRRGILLYHEA